jgi:tRNA(Ile)-lysidine synthase
MPRSNVVETVLRACRADDVLSRNPLVVVAVSGGPDSTALLHALTRAAPRLGLQLTAAHLDHALRRGSAADAREVARLCEQLKVPLVSRRQSPRVATEEAARELRHGYLESVAADLGAATVALGHTADDQAETVLLHLIRGSGLEGLAAMQVREGLRFRPLLGTWRKNVVAHCLRFGLDPIQDPSNRSPRFTRNRVRRRLIPVLETFNPQVKSSLIRLAAAAREEHEVVMQQAMLWLASQSGSLDRRGFNALPAAVAIEALRLAWGRALGGRTTPGDAARLQQAMRTLRSPRRQASLSLGLGLSLQVREDRFAIGPRGQE